MLEKCRSLEMEKKNLQFQLKRARPEAVNTSHHSEVKGSPRPPPAQEQSSAARSRDSQSERSPRVESREQSDEEEMERFDQPHPDHDQARSSDDHDAQIEDENDGQVEIEVTDQRQLSQDQVIELLTQQNAALKTRCKEIRLNLQKKITELQDTLTITKQRYNTERSELKVQYGKDLNRIRKESSERDARLQALLEMQRKEQRSQLEAEFTKQEEALHLALQENEEKAKQAMVEAEQRVQEAQRDLKKLKAESTGYYKGGWGTFIIAFEDKNKGIPSKAPEPEKSVKKGRNSKDPSKDHDSSSQKSQLSLASIKDLKDFPDAPHPIEKVKHFVEVGFLIDRVDFRLTNLYDEATFESNLKKYLFEFQDPLTDT